MAIAAARDAGKPDAKVPDQRRAFGVALGAHALHDGYTDLVTAMLAIWQAELGLAYAAVGLLRTTMSGTMAALQIPASLLAERIGAPLVLAGGTMLAGLCFCLVGLTAGFASLLVVLFVAGIGTSTQHPLASALVAKAFPGKRAMAALGTYNFAGDIGKMLLPLAATLLIAVMSWRYALPILGAVGIAAGVAILLVAPRWSPQPAGETDKQEVFGRAQPGRFCLLLSIGIIDSATRTAFLTFLPFLLTGKEAGISTIGFALTLVFLGGAAGKLVCGFLGARIGVLATVCLTEGLTALGILLLLNVGLTAALIMLPIIGVALNGTSSVLYGSVPRYVAPETQARAFGIFYTGTIGAGAVAPVLYGLLGDAVGLTTALIVIAAVVMLTVPLVIALRPDQVASNP